MATSSSKLPPSVYGVGYTNPSSRVQLEVRRWAVLFIVLAPFAATVWAMARLWGGLFGPTDLALFLAFTVMSAMGITVGFHRMLTHRGFTAPNWLRAIFLAMGSMAVEGPAVEWAATHVKHHAKSDKEGDPHSPVEGFWHAHMGWLFRDPTLHDGPWAKPFAHDRLAHFIDRTFLLWVGLSLLIPFLIGGWTGLLWGGFVRIFFVHHITWSVNSVCHTWGSRMYDTADQSRNNVIVGVLAFGEGWHNNHHAHPSAAIHGHKWWQVDASGYLIRTLEKVGIVKNVVRHQSAPHQGAK